MLTRLADGSGALKSAPIGFNVAFAPPSMAAAPTLRLVRSGVPSVEWTPSSLWADLISGRLEIRHQPGHSPPSVLLLCERSGSPSRVPSRESHVLERVLSGDQQKVIAADLGLSAAAVSKRIADGLSRLGLARDGVPLVLAALACSYSVGVPLPRPRCEVFSVEGSCFRRIVFPVPTLASARALTAAQRAIACMLLEGSSRVQIATQRGTSMSTVAGQLRAIYWAMGMTGRYGILRKVLSENLW
jgi:DNA-binding NarL/FixJ family response regulator